MGKSRDVEAKYCLLPSRMRPEKRPGLETVAQEVRAVGVQEEAVLSRKMSRGAWWSNEGGRRRCDVSYLI